MEILHGKLPPGSAWRVLVLLESNQELGRAWRLAVSLVQANGGQLLAVTVANDNQTDTLADCLKTLQLAEADCPKSFRLFSLVISGADLNRTLHKLVHEAEVDLLLAHGDSDLRFDFNRFGCAVIALRGDRAEIWNEGLPEEHSTISKLLIPTVGGPNTAHAFSFLLPLAPEVNLTALYVIPEYEAPDAEALARARLRQLVEFVDGGGRVATKIVRAATVADAIVGEAKEGYDLVVIGATRESSVDRMLFGDIPAAVVRSSKRPVAIVRQPDTPWVSLSSFLTWRLQAFIPRLGLTDRNDAYVRIRRGARPSVDYYMLISLSAMIASLGLIVDSAAVVIGAMLVAPLMSPIIGSGLAGVLGEARFLKRSLTAVLQGAFLAISVGILAGFLTLNQPLAGEVLARTQPSLIDLGIAWFSGLAAAYALCRSDAAGALPGVAIAAALVPPLATVGITFTVSAAAVLEMDPIAWGSVLDGRAFQMPMGALLLFATNFVAIALAAAIMFLILGFRPAMARKERKRVQTYTFRFSFVLLFLVALLLGGTTYQLAQEQARQSRILEVTEQQVTAVANAELSDLEIVSFENGALKMELVVRATQPIPYYVVQNLQSSIGAILSAEGIVDTIALTMTVIQVTQLDPLVPPPLVPTPGIGAMVTPSP
jgi:uncharacterized hydrophobic protein (TIGR00271 family)